MENIAPIIQVEEALPLVKSKSVLLIDATNGPNAKSNYIKDHIKGALHIDLNSQLSHIEEDVAKGGRHPLPKIEDFSKTLSEMGISPQSHVIVYDNNKGANSASRFWWMMKSMGHDKIQVLNGGIQEAKKINFPMASGFEKTEPVKVYPVEDWKLSIATMEEVEKATENKDYLIIDVREPARYLGQYEPIDLIAGHIPGALNIPLTTNLDANGSFLPPVKLREKYIKALGNTDQEHTIVHCGSGVTACHTLLAISYAGLPIPKLYVGSWSEWSRNDKPIKTNER